MAEVRRYLAPYQCGKVKTPFRLKASVICKGRSIKNPDKSDVGKSKQVAETRWEHHENPCHDIATSNHPQKINNNKLTCEV